MAEILAGVVCRVEVFCSEMAKAIRPWSEETLRSFPPHQRYLLGVSGGRDSVALLHWLLSLGYRKLIGDELRQRNVSLSVAVGIWRLPQHCVQRTQLLGQLS